MTWLYEEGGHRFVGGPTLNGRHYSKDYETCTFHPGWPKPMLAGLPAIARKAATYPALRQIDGVKLTAREYKYVQILSCASRVVFWLYLKFKWPARQIAETFSNSILDQTDVYIRAAPLKRAIFSVEKEDKSIDWQEARLLLENGATLKDIAEFYGLHMETVKRNLG